jgi:hypothetical protein
LQLGVAVREAVASAHVTAIHHGRHPGFKHTTRYTLHSTKPSRARVDMREAAKREGKGVEEVGDEIMG